MGLEVRCPSCRGMAAIDAAARGRNVQCPRCRDVFVAVPEAAVTTPTRKKRNPMLAPQPSAEELELDRARKPDREPDHDPHRHQSRGLPSTVLIGLALLPFAIPILWLMAPAIIDQPPLLSIAVPLAIAVSASTLSLAVIYTIDWSPAVRVKGVSMLISLAYLIAAGSYFVKEEHVKWIKSHAENHPWTRFRPRSADYVILMPRHPSPDPTQPIPGITLECHSVSHDDGGVPLVFVVGSSKLPAAARGAPEPGTDVWFTQTAKSIAAEAKGNLEGDPVGMAIAKGNCRQFAVDIDENETTRIVRVYVADKRVYYLAVEGTGLDASNNAVQQFFNSFTMHAVRGE